MKKNKFLQFIECYIQQRVALSDWKEKFCLKNSKKDQFFESFFNARAVERAYRQAHGEPEAIE